LIKQGFFAKCIPLIESGQIVLVLSTVRVLRAMMGMGQGQGEFFNRQMIKVKLFGPILEVLQKTGLVTVLKHAFTSTALTF
jgi:hypothetical protein